MITLKLSDKKRADIIKSVQIMGVLAEMIAIEHQNELVDTTFKNAIANQKAKRIKADAQSIKLDLSTNHRVPIRFNDDNFIQDYACELHRVFTYFIGLPVDQIKTVMDNLHNVSVAIEEIGVDYE